MTDNPSSYAETSPLAAAALAFGDLVADTDSRRAAIPVHHFETTQAAREAADRDEIADGDVIVIDAEQVVGFLVIAFPTALTEERGTFPHLTKPGRDYMSGEYMDSVVVAEREARARGFLLRDEDAQDRIRSMRHLATASAERVRTDPDPENPEWKTALDRLTTALTYLREHDPVTAGAIEAGDAEAAEIVKRITGTARP
ncbi:hypothetical protein [Streptomyces sp. DH12]|uniref:hypothetical protein n=1 Tax=Streptomyces sp. DH12 TaxID=2857010 RepID=UPI001E4A06E8|nr:hypothetical protein [Streptomyces sp. DH12]